MDLFPEVSRATDKWLQMVEVHVPRSLEHATLRPPPLSKKAS